jgi:hypothetical protein
MHHHCLQINYIQSKGSYVKELALEWLLPPSVLPRVSSTIPNAWMAQNQICFNEADFNLHYTTIIPTWMSTWNVQHLHVCSFPSQYQSASYFFTRLDTLFIFGFAGRKWQLLLFWFNSCNSSCFFTVCSLAPLKKQENTAFFGSLVYTFPVTRPEVPKLL